MTGLKQIKSKIRSTEKTRKVTKAMEAVSAAKMRKAQNRALSGRAYARAAVEILARVSGSRELGEHPLTQMREVKRALYIVITSDKGLAGALNSGVLRAAERHIAELKRYEADRREEPGMSAVVHRKPTVGIIAVGRKANDFFSRRNEIGGYEVEVEAFHPNSDVVSPELIQEIVNEAANRFSMGECDLVKIMYQNFISTFEQRPTTRTLFPLSLEELQKVVGDIVPKRGKFSELAHESENPSTYTVEPSEEDILSAILPRLASVFVYHALLESQASEHSARMVAMKSASDKGGELVHELTLKFNKARQAAITREVSEITGGMEAMAG